MTDSEPIAAMILCGGHSRRMGQPKHLLPFGSECLLQRIVRRLRGVTPTVHVVAAALQELPRLAADVVVHRDEQPDLGPLSGLATGLHAMQDTAESVFVSSCDAPFLQAAFVRTVLDRLAGHDMAIVRDEEHFHPLAAAYRTRLAPVVRALVDARRLRPIFLLDECDACVVDAEELRTQDPDLLSLQNINTPADLADALRMAERIHDRGLRQ